MDRLKHARGANTGQLARIITRIFALAWRHVVRDYVMFESGYKAPVDCGNDFIPLAATLHNPILYSYHSGCIFSVLLLSQSASDQGQ
jgi:hypothetical protein